MIPGFDIKKLAAIVEPLTIGNVPVGLEPLLLAELARAGQPVAYVMSDGQRMADLEQMAKEAAAYDHDTGEIHDEQDPAFGTEADGKKPRRARGGR